MTYVVYYRYEYASYYSKVYTIKQSTGQTVCRHSIIGVVIQLLTIQNDFFMDSLSRREILQGGEEKNTRGSEYLLCNDYFSTVRAATDRRSSPVERADQVIKG